MKSTAVDNIVYTGDNGIFKVHTVAHTTVHSIIFQPKCTSCTNMLGGEYIGGGKYSCRERLVHW